MRQIAFVTASLLCCGAAQAQFTTDYLKAADEYYRKGDFFSAAQYYEKFLATHKGRHANTGVNPYVVQVAKKGGTATARTSTPEEAVYRTAESYRQLNYHVKAEPFYKEAAEKTGAQFPLARYYHATTLRALERYADAEAAFKTFLESYTQQDEYNTAAQREIRNLQSIQQQLKRPDLKYYTVARGGAGLNDTGAAYAPLFVDSNLYFTSTRPVADDKSKKTYLNRIYTAQVQGGAATNVTPVPIPQEGETHQGAIAINAQGNLLLVTRWTIGKGTKTANIYMSRLNETQGWGEPQLLSALNAEGYSTQQPFFTPDGRLFFSSNRPGGSGGFDLYEADLRSDGEVRNVRNLGPSINTAFDEQAPYYHQPSSSLVFATNGRVGMGEFDLYYTNELKGTTTGGSNWAEPQNFGYPVNSVKDDIYFASKGGEKNILQDVLFSSDRASACCLELFSLQKRRPIRTISGTVMACDNRTPIAGAQVAIVDTINNVTVTTLTTNAAGRYTFTLEDFQPLKAVATTNNYYTNSLHFNAPAETEAEQLTNPELCLNAIKYDEPVVVENVYYEFAKWELRPESFPELDKLVKLMQENPSIRAEIGAHTDAIGSDAANMKLSEARARSVVEYLVSKGIAADRVVVKGYGEAKPLAPNKNADGSDNPAGREKNRRTEFKVLKD